MADFEVTYDPKAKLVTVEHENLLDKVRKECKDILKLNIFQVVVEVSLEAAVSDKRGMEDVARGAAEGIEKEVLKEVGDVVNLLRKLQKEEGQGNKKAATEADKAVKKVDKSLKKFASEFGIDIRKAVQKEYGKQTSTKSQLRSVNRSVFRGAELNEDAFECEAETEVPADMTQLTAKMVVSGKEIAKLTQQEKEMRRGLASEVDRVYQLIEAQRGASTEFEMDEFVKKNAKDAKAVQGLANDYFKFLESMAQALHQGAQYYSGIQKVIDKNKKLQDDKDLTKTMNAYEDSHRNVDNMVGEYVEACHVAVELFDNKYGKGDGWKKLIANLNGLKGCTKSGKAVQDNANELLKYAKD